MNIKKALAFILLFYSGVFRAQDYTKLQQHYYSGYYLSASRAKKEVKTLKPLVFTKGEVIADIGAYAGSLDLSIAIAKPGITFYLQDCQPDRLNRTGFYEMLAHFTRINGKPIDATFNFVIGSNQRTNLPDSTFDKIIMRNTFEYISKDDLYLADLRSKLKKDGKVFLITDNPFTDSYFIKIFEANGFSCEKNTSGGGWIRLLFNTKRKTPLVNDLFDAVIQKNYEKTKDFLDKGISPNSKLGKAKLLLLACSVSDNDRVIKLLIERGALVNDVTYDLFSFLPLIKAASSGDYETTKLLLENGADPNIQDPLRWAVWFGHDLRIVKLLVEKGAKIYGGNGAEKNVESSMAVSGDLETIKYIFGLPEIKDVKRKREDGTSFIHIAAKCYNSAVMKYLLEEKGFDLNEKDNEGMSVLMHAVYGGSIEMVKYLVGEKKADTGEKNKDGFTALHYALDPEIKTYLVSQGAKE
ncbi:MAG: ankyrin repeat domain-containing protein [Bacteroidia bacterium]